MAIAFVEIAMLIFIVLIIAFICGIYTWQTYFLRPSSAVGDFAKREPEVWRPGDRAPVKKPQDNLHPEGRQQFNYPQTTKIKTLPLSGDFEKRRPDEWKPGDRVPVKKPQDNLRPEGDFERYLNSVHLPYKNRVTHFFNSGPKRKSGDQETAPPSENPTTIYDPKANSNDRKSPDSVQPSGHSRRNPKTIWDRKATLKNALRKSLCRPSVRNRRNRKTTWNRRATLSCPNRKNGWEKTSKKMCVV